MISTKDKIYLTEAGRILIQNSVEKSKTLKSKLSVYEYEELRNVINNLSYNDVITLLVSENVRDFESKFGKFVKYGFAAIVSSSLGVGLTPAMMALYLYRKFTDSCELACVKKFPLSAQKKACRYKCQMDAARKILNDLRSEMGRCSGMKDPGKCKVKLQGEYMKWNNRLKELISKYHTANAGAAAKAKQQQ